MNVAIIMPAYNEEKRIGKTLESYSSYFENSGINYEILIVINNTKDRTEEIVKQYAKKNKKIRYLNLVKGGKGYAIIEGWKEALKQDFDLIGFVDADMATPPEAFFWLVKEVRNYDGAIADRRLRGSIIKPRQKIKRKITSSVFNFLVRTLYLFPYRDTQCGAKIFKKEALKKVVYNMGMTKWAFDIELLYLLHKQGFRIKQVKTIWKDMDFSKIDLRKSSVQMLFAVMQLRVIKSPFKRLLRPIKPLIEILWRLVR